MKEAGILGLILAGLCAAVSAQTEADFTVTANTDGTVTITKFDGWDTDITIPATIGGKAVKGIGVEAFENGDLTSVVIPDSVTDIGERAFAGNKLARVTLGKGVVTIYRSAFSNNRLTSIVIPDSVQSIRESAFSGNQITDLTIGSVLLSFKSDSFGSQYNSRIERVTLVANCAFDMYNSDYIFGEKVYYEYLCNDRKAGTYTVDRNWRANSQKKEADNFQYIETDYGLAITGYTGDTNRVAVPEQIDGKPVKVIAGLKRGITGVRIPASVTAKTAFSESQLTTQTAA